MENGLGGAGQGEIRERKGCERTKRCSKALGMDESGRRRYLWRRRYL